MRYEEFTGQVQARADLGSRQAAEQAVRATLETVGERVPGGVADHLAAQLPHEAAESLRRVVAVHETSPHERAEARTSGEGFDLPVFAARVAWRDETSEEEALRRAGAVLEVLDAAVAPELMQKLEQVLPPDIRDVLPSGRAEG
ncbi:DUF2267 domain-containing protein [Streptomyces sp. HNM0575]|nr:DUF2267 domain-containing protein [Streptomyces sp. HNM0575]NLU75710.1 DUF2267 domain-containing protein [Streptomyces sp. HNM0575]